VAPSRFDVILFLALDLSFKPLVKENFQAAHDRKHFHGMILELLEQGRAEEAAVCYCVAPVEREGIRTEIDLTIPGTANVSSKKKHPSAIFSLRHSIHRETTSSD